MSHELLRRFFIGLFVIIVLAMVAVVLLYISGGKTNRLPSGPPQPEVVNNMHRGNFQDAITAAQKVFDDPNSDSSSRARAQFSIFGAQFELTGDVDSFISDIEKMKTIVLDETVDMRTRVNALNVIASSYYISGNNPSVFAAIYSTAPFNSYLVDKSPEMSARKLYEWSYSMRPTADAAIGISKWYGEQPIRNGVRMTEAQVAEVVAKSEQYLKLAEEAAYNEEKVDPQYLASARYQAYRYDRVRVILRLATQIGEPYQSSYTDEINKFIDFAQQSGKVVSITQIRNVWFYQAAKLNRDGNTDGAKAVLKTLADSIAKEENPSKDSFIRFMYYELKLRPNGASALQLNTMFGLSPEFKAAAETMMARVE